MSILAGLVLSATACAEAARAHAAPSPRELDSAIALFERFNPALLERNRPVQLAGRTLAPAFSPLVFTGERSFRYLATHLTGALVSGELNELDMYLATETGTTTFEVPHHVPLSGPDAYNVERLVSSVAFIEGGVDRDVDVLVRPAPFGFSVYVQFRSSSVPERFVIQDKVACPTLGYELIRRLQPGAFSVEELPQETEDECEPYSRAPVPASELSPTDTAANYAYERRMIGDAKRRARRDDANVLAVVSASAARDQTGRVVPTEIAWRDEEEPVLRVHLRDGHYRYPVLARIDFLTGAG